ncbi:MAG: S8 family serine peptidase [Bacteroidota bacterium]
MQLKRWLSPWGVLLVVLTLALSAAGPAAARAQGNTFAPGELIVGVERGGRSAEQIWQAAGRAGAVIKDVSLDRGAYLLSFKSDEQAARAAGLLRGERGVRFVERNGVMRIPPLEAPRDRADAASLPVVQSYVPNDSLRGYQWHLDKILYQIARAPGTTAPCIVVIDTGVDYTHPDLAGKVYKGWDFVDSDGDPMDANGHGTHVAGIAAGSTNNTVGISGVSPASHILAVRVLGYDGSGTDWAVAQGILWANAHDQTACGGQPPLIYNLSLGGDFSALVSDAVAGAKAQGRLVVAAAGNSDSAAKIYPGADANAFGVAATEENDRRTYFSSFDTGADPWVDIAAPGYQILSTIPGGYEYLSGTSMASPIIAGAAARVWAAFPAYTLAQVRSRLQGTGDATQGFPRLIKRVNLYRALGGTNVTLQGQVFDSSIGTPMAGAAVNVLQGGSRVCSALTQKSGFYTCPRLPAPGTYLVKVAKSGHPSTSRVFAVGSSRFNADLTMPRTLGTGTSGDWTVTLLWNGWQPFESKGLEADIWLVDPDAGPACYTSWLHPQDADNWNLLIPYDSYTRSQTETAWIKKSYGGVVNVWVTLWDGSFGRWPSTGRITGTGLQVRIYRNNRQVSLLTVPASPTTTTADNWLVGRIDLDAGTWTAFNQIRTDSQIASCIRVP